MVEQSIIGYFIELGPSYVASLSERQKATSYLYRLSDFFWLILPFSNFLIEGTESGHMPGTHLECPHLRITPRAKR
jgi:hypothetical protein